jgi:hypothetical protein
MFFFNSAYNLRVLFSCLLNGLNDSGIIHKYEKNLYDGFGIFSCYRILFGGF